MSEVYLWVLLAVGAAMLGVNALILHLIGKRIALILTFTRSISSELFWTQKRILEQLASRGSSCTTNGKDSRHSPKRAMLRKGWSA